MAHDTTNRCVPIPLRLEVTKSQPIKNEEALASISSSLRNKYLSPGTLNTLQTIYDGLQEVIQNTDKKPNSEKVTVIASSSKRGIEPSSLPSKEKKAGEKVTTRTVSE
ncbi:6947_t:CDS:2 [Ambispora gerdemannii]|uniref:6947_t:CDS:1 n=1 Tax=Ambispora gerdemannii TaxID=144530 RepID=A0A9N9F3P8_9GLOM|nr:6947_t:CDS:2 [Ambispora gerdemannii]